MFLTAAVDVGAARGDDLALTREVYPFPPVLARPLAAIFPGMAWGIFLRLEKQRPYYREFLEFPVRARLETPFFLG
jgi:hypothetical protein